jgi:hypothetical protein
VSAEAGSTTKSQTDSNHLEKNEKQEEQDEEEDEGLEFDSQEASPNKLQDTKPGRGTESISPENGK